MKQIAQLQCEIDEVRERLKTYNGSNEKISSRKSSNRIEQKSQINTSCQNSLRMYQTPTTILPNSISSQRSQPQILDCFTQNKSEQFLPQNLNLNLNLDRSQNQFTPYYVDQRNGKKPIKILRCGNINVNDYENEAKVFDSPQNQNRDKGSQSFKLTQQSPPEQNNHTLHEFSICKKAKSNLDESLSPQSLQYYRAKFFDKSLSQKSLQQYNEGSFIQQKYSDNSSFIQNKIMNSQISDNQYQQEYNNQHEQYNIELLQKENNLLNHQKDNLMLIVDTLSKKQSKQYTGDEQNNGQIFKQQKQIQDIDKYYSKKVDKLQDQIQNLKEEMEGLKMKGQNNQTLKNQMEEDYKQEKIKHLSLILYLNTKTIGQQEIIKNYQTYFEQKIDQINGINNF